MTDNIKELIAEARAAEKSLTFPEWENFWNKNGVAILSALEEALGRVERLEDPVQRGQLGWSIDTAAGRVWWDGPEGTSRIWLNPNGLFEIHPRKFTTLRAAIEHETARSALNSEGG